MILRMSWLAPSAAVLVCLALACGANGNTTTTTTGGPGGGSAVCGVNGTNQCDMNQQCSPTLGCVECTADAL